MLLGLPPSSEEKPVLDNRPATGEEHRMLSVSSYAGALERLRGWGGGGGEPRRNWAGEDAVGFLSDSGRRGAGGGGHGDVYSKLGAEQPLGKVNVLSRSGRLRIRQLLLIRSKEVTAHTYILKCN